MFANFDREINIVQQTLNQAKIDIPMEPTREVNTPLYFHRIVEHITGVLKYP